MSVTFAPTNDPRALETLKQFGYGDGSIGIQIWHHQSFGSMGDTLMFSAGPSGQMVGAMSAALHQNAVEAGIK